MVPSFTWGGARIDPSGRLQQELAGFEQICGHDLRSRLEAYRAKDGVGLADGHGSIVVVMFVQVRWSRR